MSTHPSSDNRINSLNKWIPKIILKYPPIKNLNDGEPCWIEPTTPSLKGKCSTN